MIRKIALWGYGYNGRDTEAVILQSHADSIRITAIFDMKFEELNRSNPELTILDPAKIREYYDQGLFDEVKITVYDQKQKNLIACRMDLMGIPVDKDEEELSNRSLFRGPEYFPQGKTGFTWQEQRGYGFHVLRNMRMAFVRNSYTAFIFGEDGCILSSCWRDYHFYDAPYLRMYVPPAVKDPCCLSGEWCFLAKVWSPNYWHITYESLDQMWLLEKSGYTGRYILPKRSYVMELTDLLGISRNRIFWREDFDHETVYQFETLICTEFFNDDRKRSAPVLLEMAESILHRLQPVKKIYPRRIFVKRIGSRRLYLYEESKELLKQSGFETIVPEDLSVAEQILYFNHADIVLSPHGANTTNSLFMRRGTALIETFPYNYINPCCIETSYLSGLHYLPVVEPHGQAGGPADPYRDYRIDPHLLEMTIRNAIQLTGHPGS